MSPSPFTGKECGWGMSKGRETPTVDTREKSGMNLGDREESPRRSALRRSDGGQCHQRSVGRFSLGVVHVGERDRLHGQRRRQRRRGDGGSPQRAEPFADGDEAVVVEIGWASQAGEETVLRT